MTDESSTDRKRPDQNPLTRVGGVIIGLVILALKVEAVGHLFGHGRTYIFIICGLGAAGALMRGRPLSLSGLLAVILADVLHPHPFWGTVAYAAAIWVLLGALCVAGSFAARLTDGDTSTLGSGWLG